MKSDQYDVVVIGAGAAGIFASLAAASRGAEVLLLEKTPRIATKVLISGGGKCNVAHAGAIEDVIRAFRPNEARFLRPSCHVMTNRQIVEFFEDRGLEVYARPDGRVFPVHQTAKDVAAILEAELKKAGVVLRLNAPAAAIAVKDGRISGVQLEGSTDIQSAAGHDRRRFGATALLNEVLASPGSSQVQHDEFIPCARVIIAVGGASYPKSGTTGDGWKWAAQLGHSLTPRRAALAPIYLDAPLSELSGIGLSGCVLRAKRESEGTKSVEIARWHGDLLFTHHGVSGPCALGISREVAEDLSQGTVTLHLDLLPSHSPEELASKWMRWASEAPRDQAATFFADLAPRAVIDVLWSLAGPPSGVTAGQLERKVRNRLLDLVKNWPLGSVRAVPLEKGEVTAGGVCLDEVDPKTMRSRIVPGLSLCGEVLDLAGPVGGYNLQAAFATGWCAGLQCLDQHVPSPG